MKKFLIFLGVVGAVLRGVYLYLSRPFSFEIQEIDDSVFVLPNDERPSALEQLEKVFPRDNDLVKSIEKIQNKMQHMKGSYKSGRNDEEMNQLRKMITPDLRRVISTYQGEVRELLSGHSFATKKGTPLSEAIPSYSGLQGLASISAHIAISDCLENTATCDRSLQNIAEMMHFGRLLQDGGTLIQLMIGIALEDITLQRAQYLEKRGISMQPLYRYFSSITFPSTTDIIQKSIKQEYHAINNEMIKIENARQEMYGGSFMNTIENIYGGYGSDEFVALMMSMIPGRIGRNLPATQKIMKHLFMQLLEGKDIDETIASELSEMRMNYFGHQMLIGLIPDIKGIQSKIFDTHKRNTYIK